MKEILLNLLYIVLTVGVPFLTACLARYLRAKWQKTDAETSAAAEQTALDEIARAVSVAVAMVAQTYVNNLKKKRRVRPGGEERGSAKGSPGHARRAEHRDAQLYSDGIR